MTTFLLIVLGILLGWMIPRPWQLGEFEERLIGPLKRKVPHRFRWW